MSGKTNQGALKKDPFYVWKGKLGLLKPELGGGKSLPAKRAAITGKNCNCRENCARTARQEGKKLAMTQKRPYSLLISTLRGVKQHPRSRSHASPGAAGRGELSAKKVGGAGGNPAARFEKKKGSFSEVAQKWFIE